MFENYQNILNEVFVSYYPLKIDQVLAQSVCQLLLQMETDFKVKMKIVENLIHSYTPSSVTFHDKHTKKFNKYKEIYKENFI